jgi:hypothetical protein
MPTNSICWQEWMIKSPDFPQLVGGEDAMPVKAGCRSRRRNSPTPSLQKAGRAAIPSVEADSALVTKKLEVEEQEFFEGQKALPWNSTARPDSLRRTALFPLRRLHSR